MSEPDAELRELVATEHGLDHEAAQFVQGSTVAELEASAAALRKLVGQHGERDPEAAGPDLFAGARARKAERQQALMAALTGRSRQEQPRDTLGRYSSFDGGARRQSVTRPPESHDETLVRLLRSGEANAGRGI